MKHIPVIVLVALGLPQLIMSQCPSSHGLGPRTDDDKSLCAILYEDETKDPNTSCGGDHLQVFNGERASSIASGWNDRVSSLVIREGCTLSAYVDGNFGGHKWDMTGVVYYLSDNKYWWHGIHHNWNDKLSSYICTCWFEPVDCEPEDKWEQVISCDNLYGSEDMECTYWESHGISFGGGFSNGHSISESISAGIGVEIGMEFGKASSGVSGSLTTGYSWSESQEFNVEEVQGVKATVHVSPGKHIGVYQIQGECGDVNTKTSNTKTACFQERDEVTKRILKETCPNL